MEFDKRQCAAGSNLHNTIKLQMSAVITTVLARKVRVSLPDQSSLLLQSLGQFNDKSNQDQAPAGERQHLVVSETSEKTMKSKSVFPNLNITNTQPTFLFTNIGGNSTDKNSYASCDNSVAAHTHEPSVNLASSYSVTHQSSPATSVYSNMLASVDSDFNVSSDIFSHFIHHHQSHADLLDAAEYNMKACDGRIFRPPTLPPSLPSNEASSPVASQSNKHNVGFGILSRTYQFGAWLTKTAGGEKMEVTKKDLNALAPNSF